MTAGVNDKVAQDEEFAKFVLDSLKRHANGDWGDLSQEDIQKNELSLKKGFRLLSAYKKAEKRSGSLPRQIDQPRPCYFQGSIKGEY